MKFKIFTASVLSLIMLFSIQLGHAVVVKTELPKASVNAIEVKTSPIEKAIQQHKADKNAFHTEDELKALTAFKSNPTQSFFAAQNLRFTRFVQSIFSPSNS